MLPFRDVKKMSNFKLAAVAAFVGAMSVTSPQGAEAQTMERTNIQVNGVFVPGFIVIIDGVRTIHLLGENGLTREALNDPEAAAAFIGSELGVSVDASNFGDSSYAREEEEEEEEETPPEPVVVPEPTPFPFEGVPDECDEECEADAEA
jgi:hypothetical protein